MMFLRINSRSATAIGICLGDPFNPEQQNGCYWQIYSPLTGGKLENFRRNELNGLKLDYSIDELGSSRRMGSRHRQDNPESARSDCVGHAARSVAGLI